MGVTRGKDYVMYRNTDDPYDNDPTWGEVDNVRDLSRELSKALADASTRGSGGFRQQVGTLKELTVSFQMVDDPEDTHYIAFEDAFFDDGDQEILLLNGPISTVGSRGLRFKGQVSNFSGSENLEDVGLVDVEMVPSYAPDNPPRRVVVATPGSVEDA